MQAKHAAEGEGFLNQELFGQDIPTTKEASEVAAPSGKRPGMLTINDKHISAFNNVDGMLMVSPFIPETLKGATW